MSRILTAFALLFAVSACVVTPPTSTATLQYAPPPAVDVEPEPYSPEFDATYSTTPDVDTSSAVEVAPTAPAESRPPEGAMLAQQRAACQREGGNFMPRGTGFFACVFQTQDAGRQCDEASDCEGACLARSRTCAPMQPIFGCQEVFTMPGRRETVCTD